MLVFVEVDQVQAVYDLALLRVMSDLKGTTDLRPDVVVDFTDPGELHYWYRSEFGGSHGASLGWYDDEESGTVRLADLIQDDALEDLWGPTWPPCPGHSHPAQAVLREGEASWVCPHSRRPLSRIGSLS